MSAQTERYREIECGRVLFLFVCVSRVPGKRALFGLNHLNQVCVSMWAGIWTQLGRSSLIVNLR